MAPNIGCFKNWNSNNQSNVAAFVIDCEMAKRKLMVNAMQQIIDLNLAIMIEFERCNTFNDKEFFSIFKVNYDVPTSVFAGYAKFIAFVILKTKKAEVFFGHHGLKLFRKVRLHMCVFEPLFPSLEKGNTTRQNKFIIDL